MTNPKAPKKGWFVLLTGFWVTFVFPLGVLTGISLWIWFARPKPPTPPTSPRTTSITEVLKKETADVTTLLEEAEPGHENLIEDMDPIETAIPVMKWESTNALINAKREHILASCEQSCSLESDSEALIYAGAPHSQLDQIDSKLREEHAFRQTEFGEITALYKKMTTLAKTYPLIKERRRRLEQGHEAASSLVVEDAASRGWRQLGASSNSSRNPRDHAIRRTKAPGTSD